MIPTGLDGNTSIDLNDDDDNDYHDDIYGDNEILPVMVADDYRM